MEVNAIPNPGSVEAVRRSCRCPILDNDHGRGYMGVPGVFVFVSGCPLHAPIEEEPSPAISTSQD